MTTIIQFINSVLGESPASLEYLYYIIGGILLLVFVDAILSFIFSGLSSLLGR